MLPEVSVLHCDNSPARGREQKGAGETSCEQTSCVVRSIPLLPRWWIWLLFLLIFFSVLCQDDVVASLKHTSDINPLFRLNYWYEVAGKQNAARVYCSTDILCWASRYWSTMSFSNIQCGWLEKPPLLYEEWPALWFSLFWTWLAI